MAKTPRHTFQRDERLKSYSDIRSLFAGKARSFARYPIRLIYHPRQEEAAGPPVQVAISVPRRRFRSAVQRNRLRRRIREAYRLQKHELYDHWPEGVPPQAWMLLYVGKEEADYQLIEQSVGKVIHRFLKEVARTGQR